MFLQSKGLSKSYIYWHFFLVLISYPLYSQTDNHLKNHPQQKVYLHFDKDFYALGETMWMKAYIWETTPIADSLKKILFIDIVNQEGKVLNHLSLKIESNTAHTNFQIPENWPEGGYFIKAYSPYLMAFEENTFFSKFIPIYSPNIESGWAFQADKPEAKPKLSARFFPESGALLAGIDTKIAFIAQNEAGQGIAVKGFVKDKQDSIITRFESLHYAIKNKPQGLGYFKLNPMQNQDYQVVIQTVNGEVFNFPLIKAQNQGYTLQLDNSESDYFQINVKSAGLEKQETVKVKILKSNREIKQINLQISQNQPFSQNRFDKRQLPEGLLLLQLEDANNKIWAERIVFNSSLSTSRLELSSSQNTFRQRQNIRLNLLSKNGDNQPIKGNFSAVVRKKLPLMRAENIASYFWLSSELVHPIEYPAYYINSEEPNSQADLDVLLITQQLQSYSKKPDFTKVDYDIQTLKCVALDSITHTPLPSISIGAFSMETQKAYNAFTDKKGNFQIKIEDDLEKQTLFFFNIEKERNNFVNPPINVDIQRFNTKTYRVTPRQLPKDSIIKQYLLDINKIRLIENNFNKKDTSKSTDYSTANLGLKPSQIVKLNEYVEFADMKEFFREVTYNVIFRTKKEQPVIHLVTDKKPNFQMVYPPIYFIDGQPIANHHLILALPVSDLEKVEVFADYPNLIKHFNKFGGGGFISFTTKKKNIDLRKNINVNEIQLYRQSTKFQVSNFAEAAHNIPFFSPLVWWNENINTSNTNEFSFYTTDNIGDFEIVLEGLNAEGKPIQAYFEYKVSLRKE